MSYSFFSSYYFFQQISLLQKLEISALQKIDNYINLQLLFVDYGRAFRIIFFDSWNPYNITSFFSILFSTLHITNRRYLLFAPFKFWNNFSMIYVLSVFKPDIYHLIFTIEKCICSSVMFIVPFTYQSNLHPINFQPKILVLATWLFLYIKKFSMTNLYLNSTIDASNTYSILPCLMKYGNLKKISSLHKICQPSVENFHFLPVQESTGEGRLFSPLNSTNISIQSQNSCYFIRGLDLYNRNLFCSFDLLTFPIPWLKSRWLR